MTRLHTRCLSNSVAASIPNHIMSYVNDLRCRNVFNETGYKRQVSPFPASEGCCFLLGHRNNSTYYVSTARTHTHTVSVFYLTNTRAVIWFVWAHREMWWWIGSLGPRSRSVHCQLVSSCTYQGISTDYLAVKSPSLPESLFLNQSEWSRCWSATPTPTLPPARPPSLLSAQSQKRNFLSLSESTGSLEQGNYTASQKNWEKKPPLCNVSNSVRGRWPGQLSVGPVPFVDSYPKHKTLAFNLLGVDGYPGGLLFFHLITLLIN